MKRVVVVGLAFVMLLPVLVVWKLVQNETTLPEEFMPKRMPSIVRQRRMADSGRAADNGLRNPDRRKNELGEMMGALPKVNLSSLLTTTETGETSDATCASCFTLFRSARTAMKSFSKRQLSKMAINLACPFAVNVINSDVCKGLIHQYFDSVYHIGKLVFYAGMNQNDVCGLIFGPKCGPLSAPAHIWEVDLPAKRNPTKNRIKPHTTSAAMNILHLSDFHYDPLYRMGAVAECGDPLCCRESSASNAEILTAKPRLVNETGHDLNLSPAVVTDLPPVEQQLQQQHSDAENAHSSGPHRKGSSFWSNKTEHGLSMSPLAGRFGDLRECDMPLETIESLINDVASSNGKVSHVYLTGDIPPHDVWKSNKEEYYNITKKVYDLLADRLGPEVPVFPVVGNHEAVPPNLFTSKSQNAGPALGKSSPELYENLAEFWQPWLSEQQLITVRHGGYYAKSVSPALKVVSLNTNICYYLNFWLLVDSRDPGGQLAWLVNELADSEANNQRVHILGHVPPSSFDCIHTWSTQFLRIVQRFNETITGQFYGHTHYDHFNVFYAEDHVTPVGTAFMSPSATTYSHVNPAYKRFSFDEEGVPYKAVTRWFNLTRANAQGVIRWEVEYDTAGAFKLDDLTPASMDRLSKRLAKDDQLFGSYYKFYHRNSPSARWAHCSVDCQRRLTDATRSDVHHDGARPHSSN